jgi:hypothetical protein
MRLLGTKRLSPGFAMSVVPLFSAPGPGNDATRPVQSAFPHQGRACRPSAGEKVPGTKVSKAFTSADFEHRVLCPITVGFCSIIPMDKVPSPGITRQGNLYGGNDPAESDGLQAEAFLRSSGPAGTHPAAGWFGLSLIPDSGARIKPAERLVIFWLGLLYRLAHVVIQTP